MTAGTQAEWLRERAARIKPTSDPEADHGDADDILIDTIRMLVYAQSADTRAAAEELIHAFEELPKWYA